MFGSDRPARNPKARPDRPARRARTAIALALALTACAAAAAAPSAAEVPIPSFPPLPPIHVHLPKPQETAVFNVIVEGEARSKLSGEVEGKDGGCVFTIHGPVSEKTTYQRGKGVHMQFDRYGSEVVIHRVGRETDTSMALVVSTVRHSEGQVSLLDAKIPDLPCETTSHALSGADCDVPYSQTGAAAMSYDAGSVRLNIQPKSSALLRYPFNDCGDDHVSGLFASFTKAWPSPPPLEFGHLSLHAIYGHAHALAIKLRSSDIGHEAEDTKPSPSPFTGSVSEKAFNEATIRLVRIKG